MDAPTAPSSPPKRKPMLRRIRWSTWIVALLAIGVMVMVEIPGRRTGPTTYAHGWPWAYLERDYSSDPNFSANDSDNSNPPSEISSTGTGSSWLSDKRRDRETSEMLEETWAEMGFSWHLEQELQPWSFQFIKSRSPPCAIPDALSAVGAILAVAWLWQRRRRRRLWQFTLRTLLIAVPIIAVACAWYVAWRNDRSAETALATELTDKSRANGVGIYWSDPVKKAWRPPVWLPESIAKLGSLGEQFERVVAVGLSNYDTDSSAIEKLSVFKELRSVSLSDNSGKFISAARLQSLSRLPNLATLELTEAKINDEMLARIVAIKNLVALSIDCEQLTDRAIDRLKQLPRLRFLRLENISDARLVERLNELPALEALVLDDRNDRLRRIRLANARGLRKLVVDAAPGGMDGISLEPSGFDTLRIEDLPALETLRIWHIAAPDFQLADLPSVREVDLGVDNLPAVTLRQVLRFPVLESLSLEKVNVAGGTRLTFDSLPRLRQLSLVAINERPNRLASIRIGNLPNLEALNISQNHRLREVEFNLQPKMRELTLNENPLVNSINLRMMPQLESLNVDHTRNEAFDEEITEKRLSERVHHLHFSGLSQLRKLNQLSLAWVLLDPEQINEIAQLSQIESLSVKASELGDAGFDRLCSLRNLKEFNATDNDLDDRMIASAERLPQGLQLYLFNNPTSGPATQTKVRRPDISEAISSNAKEVEALQKDIDSHAPAIVVDQPLWLGDAELRRLAAAAAWLKGLNVEGTHLTDAGMPTFAKLRSLESLSLRSTHITDEGLKPLADLPHLQALSLADTAITGSGLRYLQNLPSLKTLDLCDTDVSDESLANLRFVPNIERLSLAKTQIGDAGLANLPALAHLKVLDLQETEVTDAGLAQLGKLKNLESLRLDNCAIAGPGLEQLNSPQHFRLLDLSNIPATDALLEHVTMLPNLQVLLVENMYDFSQEQLAALARMPNLREIHDPFNVGRIVRGKSPKVDIVDRNGPAPGTFQLFPKRKEK